MKPLKLLTFLVSLQVAFFSLRSEALNLDVKSEVQEKKSYLGASFESSSFALPEGTITGSGIKIDFSHSFKKDLNIEVYLSTAINSESSVQSSFTGLGGYLYYTLLGNCCELNKTISVGDQALITEKEKPTNSLRIGVGVDQFLLNGRKAVYSASGLGIGASYHFLLWNYQFKAAIRTSTMSVNQNKVQGIFYSIGMDFPL